MKLVDIRTDDGSRQFASLPKTAAWPALRDHLAGLAGVQILQFVEGGKGQTRMEFAYRDHDFSVAEDHDAFCFFVRDPQCSDVHLYRVAAHCAALLGNG